MSDDFNIFDFRSDSRSSLWSTIFGFQFFFFFSCFVKNFIHNSVKKERKKLYGKQIDFTNVKNFVRNLKLDETQFE